MNPFVSSVLVMALPPLISTATADGRTDDYLAGEVRVDGKSYPYLLLPPAEIVEGKRYPLVLFLHGAGERGDDNELQKMHFPERMAGTEYRERYPCFVLAPQCPKNQLWAEIDGSNPRFRSLPSPPMDAAIAALEEVVRAHPIDLDRIILTGLSMGGYGTFDLAARHPEWFASAAAICGGADMRTAARFAGLSLHVWHGGADGVVPPTRSREMVDAVRALDLEVEYTEIPGVGHNSWIQAYGESGCLDPLFAARRAPARIQAASASLLARAVAPEERVAFLGDSITQAGNRPGGYVDIVRSVLTERCPESKVIPAGISGHRVPDLLARFHSDVIDKGATLVFVYIGINDVWHSQSGRGTGVDEYEKGLRTLVRELRASGADVVLATPSVIGERPQGENPLDEMLEEYSALSRKVASEEGATLCDLRRAFQDHLRVFNPGARDKGVLTSDGVHLNSAGNVFVATEATRALRRAVLLRGQD
ncbi:MAG: hypothetical protein CMJ89_13205 [Planctomycetes bacterium]|jgi:lysophospholipase L1-like esterase/predicted esterase|nr:hypothetical protein [Planctomycetota bacterium]